MITVTGVRARRMITDKGVRAGMNPAPTTHHFKRRLGSETIPRNSVSRVTSRGGVHPRPNPEKDIKAMCTGVK